MGLLSGGLFVGAGGGAANPPTFVDVDGGDLSAMFAFGNVSNVPQAVRTVDRSEFGTPSAGDICIAMCVCPGYPGQFPPFLREALPSFMAWSNVVGSNFFTFDNGASPNELSGGLWVRECDGTTNDTCRIGGIGQFPLATQVARLSGNPFTFPGVITAANGEAENQTDADGAVCVNDLFGGFNECIEFFISWKRGSAAEAAVGEISMPAGIIQLGTAFGLDNGFDQGMMAAWGYNYSHTSADRFNGGDATQFVDNTDYSASVGARYRTDDS